MKHIDIEKLLQWAFREELPKGLPVTATPWDAMARYASLGVRVDVSRGGGDGLGFVPGSPHDDAVAIADAVRALPADLQIGDDASCVAMLAEYHALDPDAVARIMATKFNATALVIHHAVQGNRPVWDLGIPQPRQRFVYFRDATDRPQRRPLVHGVDAGGNIIALAPARGRRAMAALIGMCARARRCNGTSRMSGRSPRRALNTPHGITRSRSLSVCSPAH